MSFVPDDLAHLPRAERDLRMRIRNEIQEKVELATEGPAERRFRERTELAQARKHTEPEAQASEQARWDAAFDARFQHCLAQEMPEEADSIADACGFTLSEARKYAREHVEQEVAKAVAGVRKEIEARLVASERRAEASEARARKLEAELTELQAQARDSAVRMIDDLRQRDADMVKVDKAVASLRIETGDKLGGLRERMVAVENRPAFKDQVDSAVEAAVARTGAETRTELSVEFARLLEAQRRESAVEFQALKERLGDVASRPRCDQSQIERAAATAAETVVTQLRVGLDDVAEAQARAFDTRLVDLEARVKGAVGKLPVARAWTEGLITYEAEVVTHNGATFQAARDTAKTPGVGEDWRCLARAGRDGCDGVDGRSLRLQGAYHVDGKYKRLDIVEFQGEVFIARRDRAGLCPGADWLRLTGPRGERGPQGERGLRGSRGERGRPDATLTIDVWTVDVEHYRAVPKLSNGTVGAAVELRPLFALYQAQTASE
jgi:hypothetical protein